MKKFFKNINAVRIISIAAVIALSVGSFAGCGKKVSDKDEQGRTVITIGNYPTMEGDARDAWDAKWQKFEADNPDVKITPDMWEFDLKTFYAKEAGGRLPNLFKSHFTEIGQYMDIECVADITDVLKKRGYEGKFNPQILDIVSDDEGRIYAFPVATYILGLLINTDMFEAAGLMEADGTPKQPKDWYELADFAVKIKEKTGKPGFVFPSANNQGGWMFTCVAWSFGAEFMKQDENGQWKATFNSPEAAEALQYIKDLKWKYDVLPANTLIDATEYYKTFGVGGAAMMMASGTGTKQFVRYGLDPNSIGAIALPAGPKRHVTLMGGDLYALSKESTEDQIDAAIRWLETTYNHEATEDFKTNKIVELEKAVSDKQVVGIKALKPWSGETESIQLENSMLEKYANINLNHVKLYNDFVENCTADIQPEEPVCAQQLYEVLDGCIQEVLSNKDADCVAVLEKANSDFQTDYLDDIAY